MKNSVWYIVIACCLTVVPLSARGQYVRQYAPFPVEDHGAPMQIPFLGGLNNPKPILVDLDNDGRLDLLIGQFEGRLIYLRNVGTIHQAKWEVESGRLGGIDIGTWYTLADIDGDGDQDLFCDSRTGKVRCYVNNPGVEGPSFDLTNSLFGDLPANTNITPTFVDIDADGDLDYFLGGIGGNLVFYRNDGTAANPQFTYITDVYDSVLAVPGGGPSSPRPGIGPIGADNPMHGFSSIRFYDYDHDGDYDLFWGDIFNSSMYCFQNDGNAVRSDLTWLTEHYLPTPTLGFNHVTFGDLDSDGLDEMLLGVANVADLYTLRLYANTGTNSSPVFAQTDSQYVTMIDVGSASVVAPGDIDGDGDIDLLVGGQYGKLAYLQNVGSSTAPVFNLIDTAFANINVGYNSAPALTDWDHDGDLDLLVGNLNGRIAYYRNDGSSTSFVATHVTDSLGGIQVDQLAIPAPVDLDGDGRTDLVVGEWDFNGFANVLLYGNTGTASAPILTLRTRSLLKRVTREFTIPCVYDWDHDGRKDVVLGTAVSGLTWFRNTTVSGFPDSLALVAQSDTIPGNDEGSRLALAPVDIDGDGDDDLLLGEEDGGLDFYRNAAVCCQGSVGDVDGDPEHNVDIGDVQRLIDYLFITLRPLDCPAAGNVDGVWPAAVDIQDLTALLVHLFISFRPLATCQ